MLMTPIRCWRRREDCEPLHAVEALPPDFDMDMYESEDFHPKSFVCCGINHSDSRSLKQDAYRFCFKNAASDEISDNDIQDLTHMAAVVTQALAIVATRQVNGGTVEVPTMQGDPIAGSGEKFIASEDDIKLFDAALFSGMQSVTEIPDEGEPQS